jgi:hypothetical protein
MAIAFDFSDGNVNVDFRAHIRLVMQRLSNGDWYIWPVVGASDPSFDIQHLRTESRE